MERVILESMLSESQGRERVANKMIKDLTKDIRDLKKSLNKAIKKEVRVILTPVEEMSPDVLKNTKGKKLYDIAEKKGWPIYSDKFFCEQINFDMINLDNYYITITKDYE